MILLALKQFDIRQCKYVCYCSSVGQHTSSTFNGFATLYMTHMLNNVQNTKNNINCNSAVCAGLKYIFQKWRKSILCRKDFFFFIVANNKLDALGTFWKSSFSLVSFVDLFCKVKKNRMRKVFSVTSNEFLKTLVAFIFINAIQFRHL